MRLIDADEIKFTEYINGDVTVSKEKIDNQPTAYDIDKVVEEIKDYSFRTFGEIRTENVIEIIKGGGNMNEIVKNEFQRLNIKKEISDEEEKILIYYLTNHSGMLEELIRDYEEVRKIIR